MEYTDKQLMDSTQIAYLNCIEKAQKNFIADGKKGPFTLRELIVANIDMNAVRQLAEADGKDVDYMKLQEYVQYSDFSELDKEIIARLPDECLKWKIVDIHDTRDKNGFFACTIESSEEAAIVAFRGSEGLDNYKGFVKDWIQADFGLYNSVETNQQKETEEYAKQLEETGLLDKYKLVAATGHSLGGNLASHFGVINSYANPDKNLFNNLKQVVNFDGPGVSDEYLEHFQTGIQKSAPITTTYKWSLVGGLLYDLPGSNVEYLQIDDEQGKESLLQRIKYKTYLRHDTKSLLFNKNGKAQRGKQDIISKQFQSISRTAEKFPSQITQALNYVSTAIFSKIIYEKEDGKIGFKLPFEMKNKSVASFKTRCVELIECGIDTLKDGAEKIEEYMSRLGDGIDYFGRSMFPDTQLAYSYGNPTYKAIDYDQAKKENYKGEQR